MFFRPSLTGENLDECLWEFESRSPKIRNTVKGLQAPAQEFSQTLPRFSPDYEVTASMFYFFHKITIFQHSKEKEDIQSVYLYNIYFNFFHETVSQCTGSLIFFSMEISQGLILPLGHPCCIQAGCQKNR